MTRSKDEQLRVLRLENARLQKRVKELESLVTELESQVKALKKGNQQRTASPLAKRRALLLKKSQLDVLAFLAQAKEPMLVKEIALHMQREVAGIANALRRLGRYGFVLHEKLKDQKIYFIQITDAGREQLEFQQHHIPLTDLPRLSMELLVKLEESTSPPSVGELALKMGRRDNLISKVGTDLARRGLIQRVRDGRRSLLSLTPAGAEYLSQKRELPEIPFA